MNDQEKKITPRELERRCQLVVRQKANKYYQELLCSLSSHINLLNVMNSQGLCSRFFGPSRFQTSSSWSKPLTNFRPHPISFVILAMIVIVWSIAFWLVSAFTKAASLAKPLFSITQLVGLNWLIVGLIGWLVQSVGRLLVKLVDAFDIVLAIILVSGSRRNHSLEQSCIHIKHPPGSLLLFAGSSRPSKTSSIWLPPAGTMLQSSSVGTPAVTPLLQQKITLLLQQTING